MRPDGQKRRRATLPETVGAWLNVWTPPRDVEVPPVPVRRLLLGGTLALLVAVAAAAVAIPRIDDAKERASAKEAQERADRRAAARRRAIAQQRPRRASARDLRPRAGAPASARLAARTALLARAEEAISADARERVRAGEMDGRIGATACDPYPAREDGERPEQRLDESRGVYDCLALVREIKATELNVGGRLGYPFRAVLDFAAFRLVWCKTNPVPGERVVPDPRSVVELPRVCRKG
jgi:hypothetical protein